jgi:DNA polymerase epsilon subunit 1
MSRGHLLESETYIGGHVECLEAGVFRSDIPVKFHLVPSALSQLIDHIDRDLAFACETEHGIQRSDVTNYDEVCVQLKPSCTQTLTLTLSLGSSSDH